ncbi:MAG: sensor histidine kinase [Dissulfurispiraceae bacterium]
MSLIFFKEKNIIIGVLMTAVIFMIDLQSPLWYDAWVLYLIPLFFMYQSARRPYLYSVIVTLLTAAGLFFPHAYSDSTPLMHSAVNRITGICGGWGVSVLLMRLKHLHVSLLQSHNELEKRVEERTDELSQSLGEKEILLREIHHRVKNNLAVVSSLLSLEARKIKDAGVKSLFEESQQRVRSMALVHEKLYQTKDLSAINFESYIKSMVLDIISMYRIDTSAITTEINIGDIELDLESAVPCGLIINELLTNAFKHAFPKNGRGVLSINFTNTDGTYTLIIKDNGVGLPEGFDYREADTLGFQLVDILAGQLGGTLEIKSDKGTEAIVIFYSALLTKSCKMS